MMSSPKLPSTQKFEAGEARNTVRRSTRNSARGRAVGPFPRPLRARFCRHECGDGDDGDDDDDEEEEEEDDDDDHDVSNVFLRDKRHVFTLFFLVCHRRLDPSCCRAQ